MRTLALVLAVLAVFQGTQCLAQGLLFNLPEDGTWIRYEGTYKLEEVRPNAAEGNLQLEWLRQITIKSVGQEQVDFQGQMQACRWLEFEIITGKPSEAGIDPGPAGARVYKVLVPEAKLNFRFYDGDGIPATLLPIVRGFKRMGEGATTEIKAPALRMYPTISMLNYYPDAEQVAASEDPLVPLGRIAATHYKGAFKMERPQQRSNNSADFWISNDVPFGLAKWTVKSDIFEKDSIDARTEFVEKTKISVEMAAVQSGPGAQSALAVP